MSFTMDDSSDDSDICESSKNVQSMLVKSRISQEELNDYAYKRRLGDLIFDADFESGNLGFVENIDRYEYDLMVRPDVFNVNHRIWFNFKVSNQRYNQCVVLTLVNLSENLKLFHEGFCPVMRSEKRPKWISLNEEQVFYYRSHNHGNRFVLSLVIRFSSQDDEHQLALFYPYSYHNLSHFLDRWLVELKRLQVRRAKMKKQRASSKESKRIMSKSPEPFKRKSNHHRRLVDQDDDGLRTRSSLETRHDCLETIGSDSGGYDLDFKVDKIAESVLLKPIYCVSLGGSSNDLATNLPLVVVICRASSGNMDTVSSFVCQGLMDHLFSDSRVAQAARNFINFTIFPMVDPDSICIGNSRTDLLGRQPNEWSALDKSDSGPQSNLFAIQQKLATILTTDEASVTQRKIIIELGVDLELMGSRVTGSHFANSLRMERHLLVPKAMSKFIEGFYLEACRFSSSDEEGLQPSWVRHHIPDSNNVDYYQLELSPFGSYKGSLEARDYLRYDQVSYLTIGKALVYSLVESLRPKRVDHVSTILDKFQHNPDNAEKLTLNLTKLH